MRFEGAIVSGVLGEAGIALGYVVFVQDTFGTSNFGTLICKKNVTFCTVWTIWLQVNFGT